MSSSFAHNGVASAASCTGPRRSSSTRCSSLSASSVSAAALTAASRRERRLLQNIRDALVDGGEHAGLRQQQEFLQRVQAGNGIERRTRAAWRAPHRAFRWWCRAAPAACPRKPLGDEVVNLLGHAGALYRLCGGRCLQQLEQIQFQSVPRAGCAVLPSAARRRPKGSLAPVGRCSMAKMPTRVSILSASARIRPVLVAGSESPAYRGR